MHGPRVTSNRNKIGYITKKETDKVGLFFKSFSNLWCCSTFFGFKHFLPPEVTHYQVFLFCQDNPLLFHSSQNLINLASFLDSFVDPLSVMAGQAFLIDHLESFHAELHPSDVFL